MRTLVLCAILSIALVACGGANCDSDMDDVRAQYGPPEETTTYTADTYHSVEWWYWSKGVEYTFQWGGEVAGCQVSRYTFDPITSPAPTAGEKAAARERRRLVERKVSLNRGC